MSKDAEPTPRGATSLLATAWSARTDPDNGVIRVIAASPASPILVALREELAALAPAERPMLFALLHHVRGADGEMLTALGEARLLSARGALHLREQALIGGGVFWMGRPIEARPPASVAEGRLVELAEAPDAREIALLTFDSAWALSSPRPERSAVRRVASFSALAARARSLFGPDGHGAPETSR